MASRADKTYRDVTDPLHKRGRFFGLTPGQVLFAAGVLVIILWICDQAIVHALVSRRHPALARARFDVLFFGSVVTCTWLAWRHHLEHQSRIRTRVRNNAQLFALTPSEFEHEVARILHDNGYRDVRVLGKTGDRGADLAATDPQSVVVIIQCKRYAPGTRVGSPDVQMFIGAVARGLHGATRGIFVTTTDFTEPARQMAVAHSIELLDGDRLGQLLGDIDRRAKGLAGEPLPLRRAG